MKLKKAVCLLAALAVTSLALSGCSPRPAEEQAERQERRAESPALEVYVGVVRAGEVDALKRAGAYRRVV